MKRTALAILCFSILSVLPSQARIGDSVRELITRYGSPTSRLTDEKNTYTLTFERPGRLYIAGIDKGSCIGFTVTAIGSEFSNGEVQGILNQNAQGKSWTHRANYGDIWQRSDGAIAYVNPGSVDIVLHPAEGVGNAQTNVTPQLHTAPVPGATPLPPIGLPQHQTSPAPAPIVPPSQLSPTPAAPVPSSPQPTTK